MSVDTFVETDLSPRVKKPRHVADAVYYDFDMHKDPAYQKDPHARILDLHEKAPPIFWTPRNGGHWIFQGYSAVFDAARDPELFSSEIIPYSKLKIFLAINRLVAVFTGQRGYIPLPYPILLDPPRHTKYRQPLQRVFSPRMISGLEVSIRELAIELIDKVADSSRCDFMSAIAEPLPVRIFLKMLGLPVERLEEYRAILKDHMKQTQGNASDSLHRMKNLASVMRETMLERRETPQDDIISHLWATEIDGKPVTIDDMESYGVLLFIAGLDTVMQSMGYAVRHLAQDQALQEKLRNDPSLIDEAIEEILRRYSFALPVRRVARDVEYQGVHLKKDDKLFLFLHSANLDKAQFSVPDMVDLNRENKAHIAFNAGPHRCLGSHLARLELRILYQELLARIPQFRLVQDKPASFECGFVVALETLDIEWETVK